jgi:O-antigen/teichoic acid export membrane protein
MAAARNIVIVLGLAALAAFAPGGGDSAALISAILFTLLNVVFVFFGVRFYRERRMDIYSLGDRGRALLYGGLAGIVLALASTGRWLNTGAGTIAWIVLIGGSIVALVTVFREYREYRV